MISVSSILPKLPLYSLNQNFVFTIIIIYILMHDFLRKYLIACNAFLVNLDFRSQGISLNAFKRRMEKCFKMKVKNLFIFSLLFVIYMGNILK